MKWSQYFEADTYAEPEANKGIYIKGANSDVASITIPEDAKEGDTLIILVQAKTMVHMHSPATRRSSSQ